MGPPGTCPRRPGDRRRACCAWPAERRSTRAVAGGSGGEADLGLGRAWGGAAALLAAACGGAGAPAAPDPPAVPARRPNLVLLVADDLDVRTADVLPRLPTLIGQHGMSFRRAYVAQSQCAPARASLLTGQYPHNHGVMENSGPRGGFGAFRRRAEASTLAVWLQAAGYRTALVGKYLNGYPASGNPDYVPPGWDDWQAQLTDLTADRYINYWLNENGSVSAYGTRDDEYLTDVLARKALSFVERSVSEGRPFFLYLAPDAPHLPAIPAPRHAVLPAGHPLQRLQAFRVPSFNEADVSDKPAFVRNTPPLDAREVQRLDQLQARRARTMLAVEDMLSDLVSLLAASGALDETYVAFTSDNGLMLGEHRLSLVKNVAYEEALRVPLIVMGPGIPAGVADAEHFVLNTDLAPTLAELAGLRPPEAVDGRSLVPLLRGQRPADWRPEAMTESFSHTGGVTATLRTAEWAYTELESGETELYDMRNDPWQLASRHRGADPALLQALSSRLARLVSCRGPSCRN